MCAQSYILSGVNFKLNLTVDINLKIVRCINNKLIKRKCLCRSLYHTVKMYEVIFPGKLTYFVR